MRFGDPARQITGNKKGKTIHKGIVLPLSLTTSQITPFFHIIP
jgi:hypothetical protein